MPGRRLAAACLLAASALPGCFPFAAPPLEMRAGGGLAVDRVHGAQWAGEVSASVRPLESVGSLVGRYFDAGVGFHLEGARGPLHFGPTVEARGFPYNQLIGDSTKERARVGIGAEGRLLFDDKGNSGPFAAIHAIVEYASFVDGCGANGSAKGFVAGCGYGEAGIGGIVETSIGNVGGLPIWTLTMGITVRSPAAAGLIFGWK